jgi:hypothetical protein
MRNLCLLIAVLLAPALFQSAAPATPTAAAAKAKAGRAAAVSDADVEKIFRAKLAKSAKMSPEKFTVHVQGGVATLSGHTGVLQHKGAATRMAKSSGALAVVNNIEISQAAKDKAAQNLEKGRRRTQVKRTDTVARSQ